jgi:hypothetical protein
MRKVKRAARKSEWFQRRVLETVRGSREREELEDLGERAVECLKQISWTRARLLYAGVEDRRATDAENAARLTRMLRGNVRDKYMLEPKVVALALKLYNTNFPVELTAAWEELEEHPEVFEEAKRAERRNAQQYRERLEKAAETRAIIAAAERKEQEGFLRLQRLEEAAKARPAAAAAQGSPESQQGAVEATPGAQGPQGA